jgi:hypothetical protein
MPTQVEPIEVKGGFGNGGFFVALLAADQFRFADPHYKKQFHQARTVADKGQVLIEYLERYPECACNSDWYKTATAVAWLLRKHNEHHDLVKALIARLKAEHPSITQLQLCGKLDAQNIRPLKSWRQRETTWCHAFRNPVLAPRVRAYLSKIKAFKRR